MKERNERNMDKRIALTIHIIQPRKKKRLREKKKIRGGEQTENDVWLNVGSEYETKEERKMRNR